MPTYEYECQKCGKTFEVFQSMKDAPITKCVTPKCRGKVVRLVSAGSGLIFKGSGFYITDYKKDSGSKSDSGSTESKSETKTESKTDTKTETKTESKSTETKAAPAKTDSPKKK